MLNYIKTHWRGEHSLVRSFWTNFILFAVLETTLICLLAIPIIYVVYTSNSLSLIEIFLAMGSIFYIIVYILSFIYFVWASVGVWRSSYSYIKNAKRKLWGISAQFVVVLFAVCQVYSIYTFDKPSFEQNTLREICDAIFEGKMNNVKNRKGEFAVYYNSDETLTVSGTLIIGAAREISNFIKEHPSINTLILQDCKGETVYEAKKVANIVSKYNLDTIVETDCDFVCGQVFLAGKKRMLAKGVRLGFQKNTLEGIGFNADFKKTFQSFENNYFENEFIPFCLKQGIKQEFISIYLDKIADPSDCNAWFLSDVEMIDYKIAHETISHEQANLKPVRVSTVRYSWGIP